LACEACAKKKHKCSLTATTATVNTTATSTTSTSTSASATSTASAAASIRTHSSTPPVAGGTLCLSQQEFSVFVQDLHSIASASQGMAQAGV